MPRQSRSGRVMVMPQMVTAVHKTCAIGAVWPPNIASSRRPVVLSSDGSDYFWFRGGGGARLQPVAAYAWPLGGGNAAKKRVPTRRGASRRKSAAERLREEASVERSLLLRG